MPGSFVMKKTAVFTDLTTFCALSLIVLATAVGCSQTSESGKAKGSEPAKNSPARTPETPAESTEPVDTTPGASAVTEKELSDISTVFNSISRPSNMILSKYRKSWSSYDLKSKEAEKHFLKTKCRLLVLKISRSPQGPENLYRKDLTDHLCNRDQAELFMFDKPGLNSRVLLSIDSSGESITQLNLRPDFSVMGYIDNNASISTAELVAGHVRYSFYHSNSLEDVSVSALNGSFKYNIRSEAKGTRATTKTIYFSLRNFQGNSLEANQLITETNTSVSLFSPRDSQCHVSLHAINRQSPARESTLNGIACDSLFPAVLSGLNL
jgi:hypothetical protein